jgi:hypothetical protein
MYDWYMVPVSGYWSVKKGCSPQQLIYNYGDNHIYAVNDEKSDMDLKAHMTVYGLDGTVVSRNKYCLAETMDKHDWKKYRWWRTQLVTLEPGQALIFPCKVEDIPAGSSIVTDGWNVQKQTLSL